jgi:hypothetical protein
MAEGNFEVSQVVCDSSSRLVGHHYFYKERTGENVSVCLSGRVQFSIRNYWTDFILILNWYVLIPGVTTTRLAHVTGSALASCL